METKIDKSDNLRPSEVEEKRDWDELIEWCFKVESDLPLVDCFLNTVRIANKLAALGMPERMIESAWKLADKLESRVRPLRGL